VLGQTVLARALEAASLPYDAKEAHSAIYDAERTADLFCLLVNRMRPVYASFTGSGNAVV
jgi:ribonuclease T